MTTSRDGSRPAGRGAIKALAVLTLAALSACAVIASRAGAGAASSAVVTVVLGKTPSTPDAACPESPCRAIGRVTGFQTRNEEGGLPFRVPRSGEITAWTITLSKPSPSQRNFFNGFFGRPPRAHLGILRKVPRSKPPRYRLLRQSPVENLSPFLGSIAKFRLDNPMPVRTGDIVALSIPTWAPTFAFNLPRANVWRASRQPGACFNPTDLRQGRPQQVVDSVRTYGCKYDMARLLYTATLVTGR